MSQVPLDTLLTDLLAAAEAAMTSTPGGVPDCSRVSHDLPTWDCPLLTSSGSVSAEPIGSSQRAGCSIMSVARLQVTLLRCVTAMSNDPQRPSPGCDLLDSEAQALAVDGWALWSGLLAAWHDGTLFTGLSCQRVTFGDLQPLKPQGGLAGWRVTLTTRVPSGAGS